MDGRDASGHSLSCLPDCPRARIPKSRATVLPNAGFERMAVRTTVIALPVEDGRSDHIAPCGGLRVTGIRGSRRFDQQQVCLLICERLMLDANGDDEEVAWG
jgi:hypothetical protein